MKTKQANIGWKHGQLKSIGFKAGQLKNAVLQAAQFKSHGFKAGQLKSNVLPAGQLNLPRIWAAWRTKQVNGAMPQYPECRGTGVKLLARS